MPCSVGRAAKRGARKSEELDHSDTKRPRLLLSPAAELRQHLDVAYRKVEQHQSNDSNLRLLQNFRAAVFLRERLIDELTVRNPAFVRSPWERYYREQIRHPLRTMLGVGDNLGNFWVATTPAFDEELKFVRDTPLETPDSSPPASPAPPTSSSPEVSTLTPQKALANYSPGSSAHSPTIDVNAKDLSPACPDTVLVADVTPASPYRLPVNSPIILPAVKKNVPANCYIEFMPKHRIGALGIVRIEDEAPTRNESLSTAKSCPDPKEVAPLEDQKTETYTFDDFLKQHLIGTLESMMPCFGFDSSSSHQPSPSTSSYINPDSSLGGLSMSWCLR
ncbi:hypothetical protein CAPTEDRAFT_215734 [Capitella teleta]|uniref:Uncharacterized protein n=1 Tax=Capitella teleta TaxID=283909 RepID=R7VJ72_CAPTE|nr:hypothetical protein CAPTEDRAFT_215734 [Capitella teleta]|eukprot:ELU15790.1 hypothetical protein CAPTEDRAFT_215734 [Capitella teleta]